MAVDHLPQPTASMPEAAEQSDDCGPATEVHGAMTRGKEPPAPAPEENSGTDESWQQAGFGSFP